MLVRTATREGCPDRCAIAVMAKASIPGKTKTRLAPPLSFDQAARLNTAFLKDVSDNLRHAGEHADLAGYMAYGPPGSTRFFEDNLPPELGLIETWFPDFGECLFHPVSVMLRLGYGSACVLNSDSPTLPTEFLVEAAETLARPGDRMVLGPSFDGGYYLLGLKQEHRRLFEDVAWSTASVAEQTLERATELGLETVILPEWYDVDGRDSLVTLASETARRRSLKGGPAPYFAPHVTAEISMLIEGGHLAWDSGLRHGERHMSAD